MEPQTQQGTEDGNKTTGSSANMVCRQSSFRWTPTTDQIRILKELYYNKGVRSPSAEQIQRICLQLKRYGKIEGKNVFYWFQNHKARERQKKRFTSDVHVPMQRSSGLVGNGNGNNWKPKGQYMNMNNKYSNICQGASSAAPASASSGGVIAINGQMGNYGGGYGSMNMEKSFRDCSISDGTGTAGVGAGGSISHNFGSWVGGSVDPYSSSSYTTSPCTTFFDIKEQNFMEQEEEDPHQEIETLPLFPMHGDEFFGNIKTSSEGGYGYYNGGGRTSLELSLNSYGYNNLHYN